MKVLPRILKINEVTNGKIYCVFNTGEYRIVDINKFIAFYNLTNSKELSKLSKDENLLSGVTIENNTLTWPNLTKEIILKSGTKFSVNFDLDPIMLYNSSEIDTKRNNRNKIGHLLKNARKSAGLTQEELANRVGTTKNYISRIENDRSDIEFKTLKRIVEVGLDKRLAIVD